MKESDESRWSILSSQSPLHRDVFFWLASGDLRQLAYSETDPNWGSAQGKGSHQTDAGDTAWRWKMVDAELGLLLRG